jgi:glyoxylase-like metal-dependent hydrolase (beta-lactamase superfamily II)
VCSHGHYDHTTGLDGLIRRLGTVNLPVLIHPQFCFPARARLVRRYGRAVSDLPYWVAFSRWRSACIGVGVRARYLAGHMGDDGFAARFLTSAEPGAAGSRVVLAEAARDALREGSI